MTGSIHVVEQGDGWEVRREGDSMPLGTYLTLAEAEEKAQAQADLDDVAVVEHDRDVEVEVAASEPEEGGAAAPDGEPRGTDTTT